MFDSEPDESGDLVTDDACAMAEDSTEGVPPAELADFPSTASVGPADRRGVRVNENDIIARFFRGASRCTAEISGDVTVMADALVYRLARGQALDDGEK